MISTRHALGILGIAIFGSAACGSSATELGSSKNPNDGGRAAGGAAADAATGAGGGAAAGGTGTDAATGAGGGAAASDAGETGGLGGTTGATGGSGGLDADGPLDICKLPAPTPSTAEQSERDRLIRAFCTALLDAGCSYGSQGRVSTELAHCPHEDRVRACVIDAYNDYEMHIKTAECDALWRAAAECVGKIDYSAAGCQGSLPITETWCCDEPRLCDAEKEAVHACHLAIQGGLTGSRGFCSYGPDPFKPGDCAVLCDATGNYFEAKCSGGAGLPVSCDCFLNGHVLWDDGDAMAASFLAADCRDAAARMAAGTCFERVDCCFTWLGSETPQREHCSCTSDPMKVGYESCEAAAAAMGGRVVDLCPQYAGNPGCIPRAGMTCP